MNKLNLPDGKDFAFCITLDDLHPENVSDLEGLDFGSDVTKPPMRVLGELFSKIPEIKTTIFTVPNWQDRSDWPNEIFFPLRKLFRVRRGYSTDYFKVSDKKFSNWVSAVSNFYPGNIEIATHGLSHHNKNLKYARSQEFLGLDGSEVTNKLAEMVSILGTSGLSYHRGFRPPGWGVTEELTFELNELGFSYIAGEFNFKDAVGDDSDFITPVVLENGIVSFTANCYPDQTQRAVEIARRGGALVVHAHLAKTEFGLKYVDKEIVKNIEVMLREIYYQTGMNPWFCTLGELAESTKTSPVAVSDLENVKVSAVLTVFNGENVVIDALKSLCEQSYGNLEIIVVNDGSTDKTSMLLEGFTGGSSRKIKTINQENKGRAGAKNTGLREATGELVVFCEDDAVYSPQYIKNGVKHFVGERTLGVIGPHFVLNKFESITTRVKDIERRRNFLNYNPQSCWFYRTSELRGIGGFNEGLTFGEDIEPCIKLKRTFPNRVFVFESGAVWLHREPAGFWSYLKRKFLGGMGMVILDKKGIKPLVIPSIHRDLFRLRDIKNGVAASNEGMFFVIFGVLLEYVWWFASFCGVMLGRILAADKIKNHV